MLNRVLVAKFVTAMTLAGLATGAAAGLDVDDPADDGDTIELEVPLPLEDDETATSDDETTEDEAGDADDSEGELDDEAADDESSKPEKDADESEDGDAVKETKAPTHGSIVSECARNTELTGRDKGQAVSTVAKDDTAECAVPAEEPAVENEAPADESDAETEDKADDKPRPAKAQGAEHRNEKATEKLAERDARKADR